MKISVFHVFSGSKHALIEKTGGVETLLNSMFHYGKSDLLIAFIGRSRHIFPQLFFEIDQDENVRGRVGEISESRPALQSMLFPYLPYVLSNLILGLIISWLLCALSFGQKKNAKVVIHAHDPIIGAAVFLMPSKGLRSAAYVSQFHSEYTRRLALMLPKTSMTRLTLSLYSFFERMCVFRADKVIAVNENVYRYLIEIGCPPNKVTRVPVFLDPFFVNIDFADVERTRRTLNMNREDLVLTYTGRLSKEKNLEILITTFLDLDISVRKNLKMLIVGEGEQLNELKSLSHASDGILFTGHRTDINQILSLSDIFVLPSFTEGFPLSLLEAMTFGKAIIASNIAAIREIIDNEKEAILFDPRSPEQLGKAILRFCSSSDLRREFGENAKKKASKYSINDVYPRILEVYHESLRKKDTRVEYRAYTLGNQLELER